MLVGALGLTPRAVFGQVAGEGRQYNRNGFAVGVWVREQTIAECGSSDERRKGKNVEVTVRCRELAGAGSGKSVTMRAALYDNTGLRSKKVDKCRDTFKTSGNVDRVHELTCSLKLPRDAR